MSKLMLSFACPYYDVKQYEKYSKPEFIEGITESCEPDEA